MEESLSSGYTYKKDQLNTFLMRHIDIPIDIEGNINEKLFEIAYNASNYNRIPPIIGIIIANQYGNTIMVFEYDYKASNSYGPLKSYLSEDDKNLLEIDLISMYFSSLKTIAGQVNIQNLSHLEILGSNIKIQIYFLLEKYMIIVFLNSNTDLNFREKSQIMKYFKDMLTKNESSFDNFNTTASRKIIKVLENKGKAWIKKLNSSYNKNYRRTYIKKHENVEELMNKLNPVIQNKLVEYLENIPNEILNDLSKEIGCRIQDVLFEFKAQ